MLPVSPFRVGAALTSAESHSLTAMSLRAYNGVHVVQLSESPFGYNSKPDCFRKPNEKGRAEECNFHCGARAVLSSHLLMFALSPRFR